MKTFTCSKCGGSGYIPGFSHVMGGVCFNCNGVGTQKTKPRGPIPTPVTEAEEKAFQQAVLNHYLPIIHAESIARNGKAQHDLYQTNAYNRRRDRSDCFSRAKRDGFTGKVAA